MKEMKNRTDIFDILILSGLTVTLVIILIPLFMISKYSFMSADDFSYMYQVGGVWKESHSVLKTLWFEAVQSYETWKSWQGLYFADWLYFVLLAIFAEKAYFVSTFIGLISLIVFETLAAFFLFHKVQGTTTVKAVTAILPVIMFQILLPPSGMEAFFWMPSVALYTFPFAVSILYFALIYSMLVSDEDHPAILRVLIFVMAFVIAGSNYVTGLAALCLTGIVMISSFFEKRNRVFFITLFIWFVALFALNALSPGAGVRQASAGEGDTALHAIMMSFVEAAKYIKTWTNLPVILLNVSLLPLFIGMMKNKKIRFRFPVLFTLFSFCVFASMFTSNLYALKIIGMYRVQNLYRFTMFLLLPLNLWYWTGYLSDLFEGLKKKKSVRNGSEKNEDFSEGNYDKKTVADLKKVIKFLKLPIAFLATVLIAFCIYKYYGKTATSISAYYSLRENEAKIYHEEWEERLEVYNDPNVTDAVFKPYTRMPYLLHFVDISTDNTDWVNEAYARYFGKNTVTLSNE